AERHLLFVPVLDPLGEQFELAVRPAEDPPERDVPALVVSDAGLGPDVAEHDVDLAAERGLHRLAGHGIEEHGSAFRVHGEAGGHRKGVALVVQERHHRVGVAAGAQALQELRRGAHRAASTSSNTCGGRDVSPSSHRKARRGTISITPRSKNSGRATRLPRKKSMAGSFFRQIGRTRSQPAWRSVSSTVASPWMVARRNRLTVTALGSLIDTETLGFAFAVAAEARQRVGFPLRVVSERRSRMRKSNVVRLGMASVALLAMTWTAGAGQAASGVCAAAPAVNVPDAAHSTVPLRGCDTAPGHSSGVDRVGRNRNITKKTGAQSETSIAVDPTNPLHMYAASNDLANFSTYNGIYESFDRGLTWASAGLTVNTFCYDPWLDFNAAGDIFFSYECSDQRIAYKLHGTSTWVQSGSLPAGSFPDRDQVVTDDNVGSPHFGAVYIGYDDNGNSNRAHIMISANGQGGWTE